MNPVPVLIGSPLKPMYVEQIRQVSPRIDFLYRPDLLGTPHDHTDPTGPYWTLPRL